jgi:hypothetical protein
LKSDKHFISYSRTDASDFALKLAGDLKAAGFNIWIDQQDIHAGTLWDAAVQTALNEAECVIIILSHVSVKSSNVLDEVSYALGQKKRVYPILKEDCEIPLRLDRIQRIDFRNNYDKAFKQLISTLDEGQIADAPPPTIPTANKWKKIVPFLLAGIALLSLIYFIANKKQTGDHAAHTKPIKIVKTAEVNVTNSTLFTTPDYKARYEIKNDALVLYIFCNESFPGVHVDVNQNKIIDSGYDRAYGIRGGTINVICPSFILTATDFTPCDSAASQASVTFLDKEYAFTLPLEEIKGAKDATTVSFQIFIYTKIGGRLYFPSANGVDFNNVYTVRL